MPRHQNGIVMQKGWLFIFLLLLFGQCKPDLSPDQKTHISAVANTPGLVAFWDFVESENGIWTSHRDAATIDQSFPLHLRRIGDTTDYTPDNWPYTDADSKIQYDHGGPFGKAVHFNKGYIYGAVPRATFDNTLLDMHGKKPFTLITWMKFTGERHLVAGIWDEGGWAKYSGRRQVALFGGLFSRDGLIAHISKTGASSFPQSELSGSQYARVRAIDGADFENGAWVALAMTYDPDKNEVVAYLNGKMTALKKTDPIEQDVYQYDTDQVANPLYFTGPVYSPRAFTIKYNGYLSPEAAIKEHRALVDLNEGLVRYERDSVSVEWVGERYRLLLDVQRNNNSILAEPVVMDATHGHTTTLSFREPVQEGDMVMTSLEKQNGNNWEMIGTRIERIIPQGAPFTLGRALGLASEEIEHGSQLFIDGVAVFSRVLGGEELVRLSFYDNR